MKQRHIQHLYWRAGFGIGVKKIDQLKSKSKNEIIKDLFYDASKVNLLQLDLSEFNLIKNKSPKVLKIEMGEEAYRKLRQKSQRKVRDLNYAWLERLTGPSSILREKMTLFWSNVFVCRDNHIFHIQHFNNTFRKNALGNFRVLVKTIAKEASMSKYLNNRQNRKKSPNENFARELMELFTLGIGNYTEQDIKEAARAFTGWSFKLNGDFVLRKKQHDAGVKTFFDKSGYFGGDDIIDLILEKKQCARFICDKVYRYFVNPIVDPRHLDEITTIFFKDYDINNLMMYIFNAKWFYNDENIGVKIDFNDYKLRAENKQCLFYDRDRGEKNKEATTLKDESALLEFAFESCDAEVVYMFAYGSWYVYDNSDKIGNSSYQFIELEEALYNVLA